MIDLLLVRYYIILYIKYIYEYTILYMIYLKL